MITKKKQIKVTFPELYKKQLEIFKSCLNVKNRYIVVNGSRQVGKSILLANIALYYALNKPNQDIMVLSKSDAQKSELQERLTQILEPIAKTLVKQNKIQAAKSEIKFVNGSRILFRSAGSESSLRGYSLKKILLDEVAFMKESVWQEDLMPSLSTAPEAQVIFCSTPFGQNFFQKLYIKGMNNEPGFKSFKLHYTDNPYAQLDWIEDQKNVIPPDKFDQEFNCSFVSEGGVFKNIDELAILDKSVPDNQECVIGIDIAFKKDYTVAMCLGVDGKMLDYIRFNQTDIKGCVSNLKDFIDKWKPRKTVIEDNNQGLGVYQLLIDSEVSNLETFNTNGKSKSELINSLMIQFSKKEIFILNDDIVKEEMKAFAYNLTKNGNVQFSAAYGHDDIVMATALAQYARSNFGSYELYVY